MASLIALVMIAAVTTPGLATSGLFGGYCREHEAHGRPYA